MNNDTVCRAHKVPILTRRELGLCTHRLAGLEGMQYRFERVELALTSVQSQWNQPSIDFYEKTLGATAMTEWMGMRLEGSQIENLRKFRLTSS